MNRKRSLAVRLREALNAAEDRFVVLVEDPPKQDEIVRDVLTVWGISVNIPPEPMEPASSYSYCVGTAPDVRIGKDWQVFRVMRGGAIHVFAAPESVICKLATP